MRIKKDRKLYVTNSALIVFAFCVVFYSRILATTTRISPLNLLHFLVVPAVAIIALSTTRSKDPKQIAMSFSFVRGLYLLFGATVISAIFNHAGLINALVSFMMLGEPFIFVMAIGCIPMSSVAFSKIRNSLYWGAGINFVLAALQKPLIESGRLSAGGLNGTDGCGGVFFVSGAGNYISATVSLVFAMYFFMHPKGPFWLKFAIPIAATWHILFSDSKQIIMAYIVAWILLIMIGMRDIVKTLKLTIAFIILGFVGIWCVQNLEGLKAFTAWARPELYGENGLAWHAKFYSLNLILAHYQSPLNWLVGLGPGHTVSRLGAWFLRDYAQLLGPLGSTQTNIGADSMNFVANFWLTSGSSLFSPIFGWVGIWGDLGYLGLGAYLYLCYLVWKHFGLDNNLKITLLSVVVMGAIFTQMEEPGYMLTIAYVLGLSWQERYLNEQYLRQNWRTRATQKGSISSFARVSGF